TFEVRFDPQSTNLPLEEVGVLLPIKVPYLLEYVAGWALQQMSPGLSAGFSVLHQVAGGPTFHVRLHANVAVPSLCISRDRLEFSTVQCGQCQEETVQFHNLLQIPCKWFITVNEPVKKVKHRQR
ncbi:HYDIN protein, partial [Chunga burmeisteri]|nr:HYDIN protein [Chunga burmeisteri]